MTSHNELCEELKGKTIVSAFIKKEEGKEEYDDTNILQLETADGSIFEVKGDYGGYTGNSQDEYPALISIVKRFTPKIKKTEVQTICPLGETIPDFTQEIEKFKENNNHLRKKEDLYPSAVESDVVNGVLDKRGETCTNTPNCEICRDYSKEYWCGNPKNKVSTPNEDKLKEMDKAFEHQKDENEEPKEW